MPFKINARTMLQLGAELISSDAVALYELIKNAFDANSKRVEVLITVNCDYAVLGRVKTKCENCAEKEWKREESTEVDSLKRDLKDAVAHDAPDREELLDEIERCSNKTEFDAIIDSANRIEINDTGDGMSMSDLDEVYLTIGTRSRLDQRKNRAPNEKRPILGEKGIGRLSSMRLGRKITVTTSRRGESRWNVLEIDWDVFGQNTELQIGDIDIRPRKGDPKDDSEISGTRIKITSLSDRWNFSKAEDIARNEFAKLRDPLEPRSDFPLKYRFNRKTVASPKLEKDILDRAHAFCTADYEIRDGLPRLSCTIIYTREDVRQNLTFEGEHLLSTAEVDDPDSLVRVGPFGLKFYWYNRQLLFTGISGLERARIKKEQALWAGGLLMYRDGFRVYPYGSHEDDWLDLDKSALGGQAFKVNRRQIIGRVLISSHDNPHLVDQTNREGLRDSPEKAAFRQLLITVFGQFKSVLEKADKDKNAADAETLDEVERKLSQYEKSINASLRSVLKAKPELSGNEDFLKVSTGMDSLRALLAKGRRINSALQQSQDRLVHLASLGLLVESVAHELNRSCHHILNLISEKKSSDPRQDTLFFAIATQVKTLQKRLSILDPLATSGRQRKVTFELVSWVKEILKMHASQFDTWRRTLSEWHSMKMAPISIGLVVTSSCGS